MHGSNKKLDDNLHLVLAVGLCSTELSLLWKNQQRIFLLCFLDLFPNSSTYNIQIPHLVSIFLGAQMKYLSSCEGSVEVPQPLKKPVRVGCPGLSSWDPQCGHPPQAPASCLVLHLDCGTSTTSRRGQEGPFHSGDIGTQCSQGEAPRDNSAISQLTPCPFLKSLRTK